MTDVPSRPLTSGDPAIWDENGRLRLELPGRPDDRAVYPVTGAVLQGFVDQVNELRTERDRLHESLARILDLIGPDSFCGCEDCDKEQPAREQALLDAARLINAESLPDLEHLQRVRVERPDDSAAGSEAIK